MATDTEEGNRQRMKNRARQIYRFIRIVMELANLFTTIQTKIEESEGRKRRFWKAVLVMLVVLFLLAVGKANGVL